jgi:hypothetical protein
MASVTSWNRLEIHCRDTTLAESVQCRIHDPLWLLARQWQVGEFIGDDGGSPVQARARLDVRTLGWYAHDGGPAVAFDPLAEPLEARVERELAPVGDLRLAIAGGRRLLGFLQAHGGTTATRSALLTAFSIKATPPSPGTPVDLTRERLLSALVGRAIDGEQVYAKVRPTLAPDGTGTLPTDLPADPALLPACADFLGWWEARTGATADAAWADPRMEYEFAVATSTGDELVLTARGHGGGPLDWPAFDVDDGASIRPAAGANAANVVRTMIPAPVEFRGMPAARFWEIEDGAVDLGAIDAASDDLARLLVMEFALVYGNDFFVIPVRLPVGTVSSVASLVVTDSFGVRTLVDSAETAAGGTGSWSMYRLSADRRVSAARAGTASEFLLAPALGQHLEADAVEEVLFVRDEAAAMAWAVERRVEGGDGRALDRFEAYEDERRRTPPVVQAPAAADLVYRLATQVPPYWFPLLPLQSGLRSIAFELGEVDLEPPPAPAPAGRLLTGKVGKLQIAEAEVDRAGLRVAVVHRRTRWIGGTTQHWIGRDRGPGRGEGASGLRFDVVESPPPPA